MVVVVGKRERGGDQNTGSEHLSRVKGKAKIMNVRAHVGRFRHGESHMPAHVKGRIGVRERAGVQDMITHVCRLKALLKFADLT